MKREIQPHTGLEQVLYLFIGLCAAKGGIQIREDDLRHFQPDGTGDLSTDKLGDKRFHALAGAPELEDI